MTQKLAYEVVGARKKLEINRGNRCRRCKMRRGEVSQCLFGKDNLSSEGLVFQVVPYQFIRIQLGRVRWQIVEFKVSVLFFNKALHGLGLVSGMTVDNEENGLYGADPTDVFQGDYKEYLTNPTG